MMMAQLVPPAPGARRGRRVLVVEDEGLIRIITAEHLRGSGYEVLEARNGDEAVLVLKSFSVDLVITDFNMPGALNGLGLARWIDANRPGLPVLLISAVPPPNDPETLSVAWPAIVKPYRFEVLEQRIEDLFAAP